MWLIIKIEIQFIYLFILYVYYAWVSMCVHRVNVYVEVKGQFQVFL